jgi:hypothetical protein
LRTTFRVSVKVAVSVPIAIAPTPSGPSAMRAASVEKLATSSSTIVSVECRVCRLGLPLAVLRW